MNNLTKWSLPDSYFGAEWPEYYVGPSQHRDSDCVTRSNFITALEMLGGESETVVVVRESHWAVGWVEWIAVHESDAESLHILSEIVDSLEDYPVLSDDHLSELEYIEANQIWARCYDWPERIQYIREHRCQFEFYDWSDLVACVRGEYFSGYASELIY